MLQMPVSDLNTGRRSVDGCEQPGNLEPDWEKSQL